MATRKDVYRLQEAAQRAALEIIEREARHILSKNPRLDEYVQAMGSAFFTDKQKGDVVEIERVKGTKRFLDFIDYCDDTMKICGEAMRFTATGPKRTDW